MKRPDEREAGNRDLEAALAKIELTDVQRDLLRIQWLGTLELDGSPRRQELEALFDPAAHHHVGAVFVPALVAVILRRNGIRRCASLLSSSA